MYLLIYFTTYNFLKRSSFGPTLYSGEVVKGKKAGGHSQARIYLYRHTSRLLRQIGYNSF